jgi:hypothetical protein
MKRLLVCLIMASLLMMPVSAYDFPTSQINANGISLYASVSADTPWQSPFSKNVTLTFSIEPDDPDTTLVNISSVLFSLSAKNPTGSGFSLVDAHLRSFEPPITGTSYANYTGDFTFSSSMTGEQCYFALTVEGIYSNSTDYIHFQIVSNESFIGPFLILASLATPQVFVGLVIGVAASVVIIAGLIAVKRNRSTSKRRRLLSD